MKFFDMRNRLGYLWMQSLSTILNYGLVINTYCYISGTFVLPRHWDTELGIATAQDGVGPINTNSDETRYKNYYQWVPFVLFLQSLMFYTPHTIFKIWEGEKVQTLINGLDQIVLNKGNALCYDVCKYTSINRLYISFCYAF